MLFQVKILKNPKKIKKKSKKSDKSTKSALIFSKNHLSFEY